MSHSVNDRLAALGIELTTPSAALANYVPCVQTGNLVFISGQLPISDGEVQFKGHLGKDVDIETGQKAARLCAINLLSQLKAFLGNLERIEQCVRLCGFVSSQPDFYDHAPVVNGASDLVVEVFGDQGRHCRAAIGCASLPLNAAVEVEGLFKVKDQL